MAGETTPLLSMMPDSIHPSINANPEEPSFASYSDIETDHTQTNLNSSNELADLLSALERATAAVRAQINQTGRPVTASSHRRLFC